MSTKRILSLVLTLTLILGSFSFAFADTANTDNTTAKLTTEQKIAELVRLGFVKGDGQGNLNLDKSITRAETSTIVSKAVVSGGEKDMTEVEKEIEKSRYQSRFSDVPTSHWANPYINVSVQEGIVVGYPDNTFKPENKITYAEVITMMVNVLGEAPTPGVKWPDNYIGKARALGILEGINVNYTGEAIRGGVFELLYNTVTSNKVGNYNIDKVIVLENNRVESLGTNEIVVEVIKEVQRANFIKNPTDKAQRGDQMKITVPAELPEAEVEDLLGKVIDLSYDATNKAVRVELDNTYQYVVGKVELDSKTIKVEDKSYTVLKEEQYEDSDERIFSTYVNNEDYTYDKAQKEFKTLDFGRATVKNGKVLFIDGFAFDDIAPVKQVNKDGKEIVVYNDINDGGEKKIELDTEKVISFTNGSFKRMDKKDIAKMDVIHVGEDTKGNQVVVVREDAQVNGTYDKVVEYKDEVVVVVDGKEYEILDVNAKRSVYSANSEEFRTLFAQYASRDLKGFEKEKVTVLRDINGDLQYIGAQVEFGEFVGLLDRAVGKDARIIKKDNTKSDYVATLDSKLESTVAGNTTALQELKDFNRGDLVFVSADKTEIDSMVRLSKNTDKGAAVSAINTKFVTVDGKEYRVFDRTNVFVRNGNGTDIYATTLQNVIDNATVGTYKAVVITDAEYAAVDPRFSYDKSENIINTIVFTDISLKQDLNYKNAEITSISNRYEQIEVKYADGSTTTLDVQKDSEAYESLRRVTDRVQVGDIVEVGTLKDNAKVVKNIKRLIPVTARGSVVDSYNPRTKELKLVGDSKIYFLSNDTDNFVTGSLEKGKEVAVYLEGSFVEAIADRSADAPLVRKDILQEVITTDGKIILKIDNVLYQFAGNLEDVTPLKNKMVEFKSQELNGVKYIFDVKAVAETPGKVTLGNLIATSNALVEADYTAASFAPFKTALTEAAKVYAKTDATQAEIDKAVTDLEAAKTTLVLAGNVIEAVFTEQIAGNKVTFKMPVGQTVITTAKVNTVATTSFYVDTASNEGQVRVNAKTDIVVVTIAGIDYKIVAK